MRPHRSTIGDLLGKVISDEEIAAHLARLRAAVERNKTRRRRGGPPAASPVVATPPRGGGRTGGAVAAIPIERASPDAVAG